MSTKRALHIVKKTLLWTLISIVGLVILIPVLLYIPFVQDIAKDIAISKIEESTGMDVTLNRLRLKFPLRVELQDLSMSQQGDTLLAARSANVDVAFWPLFKGTLDVDRAELIDAKYRMNTPDSALYMKARIDKFVSEGTDLKFNMERINVGPTVLDGADILLVLKDTITPPSPPDTAAVNMIINAPDLQLRNINFRMKMLPTIDSLQADIGLAQLRDGKIDMGAHTIDASSLSVSGIDATYLTPSAQFLADYKAPAEPDSLPMEAASQPWRINVGKIDIEGSRALYAMAGARPVAGLDMNYLQAGDIKISIDSFYNCGSDIRVPLRTLRATERCGLQLNASGTFAMDSTAMKASDFRIATQNSALDLNAMMGLGDLASNPDIPLSLRADGHISLADVYMAYPTLAAMMKGVPETKSIQLDADIHGRSGMIDISRLNAQLPGYLMLNADGQIANPMDFNRMNGHVNLDGRLADVDFLKSQMLDAVTSSQLRIPPMTLDGDITYSPGLVDGDITVKTGAGRLALDVRWNQKTDGYNVKLSTSRFPVESFMPGLGIANVSTDAHVTGRGYDIESRSTKIDADIDLQHIELNGRPLENITLKASLDTCRLVADISSANEIADLDINAVAHILKSGYQWNLSGDARKLDLQALGLSQDAMGGSVIITTNGSYNPRNGNIDAALGLDNLHWQLGADAIDIPQAQANIFSVDSLTRLDLTSQDFVLKAESPSSLDSLMSRITATGQLLSQQIEKMNVDVPLLQSTMPKFNLSLTSSGDNAIASYLAQTSDVRFKNATLELSNDSLINMTGAVDELQIGSTRLDRTDLSVRQRGRLLTYDVKVDNRPGTMDDFAHIDLRGYLGFNRLSAIVKQSDIKDCRGFHLGLTAQMADSTVTLKFVPYNPTIAYKDWTINRDNYVSYDLVTRHLDANLKLMSDSSSLYLYTEHTAPSADSIAPTQEDVILRLDNINIAEWLSLSPFAPPVKGDIDANLRFRWDNRQLTGKGDVNVNNLYYGRDRVGTFDLGLDIANDPKSGLLRANVDLFVDKVKVITATGNLNDSTAANPFLLDFSMIHFPLRVVNPFLPKDVAQLSGMLNGRMDITGDIANPVFNGYIDFDSTAVKVGMTGASYAFSEESIPVDSNVVKFNDFSIAGLNKNNLFINGTVNARQLSNILIDLKMKARDMQIINSTRPRGASVYGKAFIDLDASAKGNMQYLDVDARLDILAGTNVTYVVQDAESSLTSQGSNDMVKFVSFSDTAQVAVADSLTTSSLAMSLDANLIISEGSTINVDLSTDGKNKVSIQGNGNLTYTMTPMSSDGRLTGRLNINKGFVRYTPPLMSEKNFTFQEGCYIAFTGALLNPTLHIKAIDRLRANVTQEGQNSRLVNFDVVLSVTNTLENMNVAFDLTTNDDLTIQNELQSMSPEQRANQAMNMLLYNQYTGPGTKATSNLSGNPLYSFLESQVNSWAANNIKGVDISFGIDQYDKTTDGAKSTTTSYSYRVSKSLFNDRFKIVVGGNYSTDADADENFSQNLINDISFEYMLNRSGSMYVRLFRHVGYESILEGEITQTGVGFVLKRKLNSLRDIFRFSKKSDAVVPKNETDVDNTSKQPEK